MAPPARRTKDLQVNLEPRIYKMVMDIAPTLPTVSGSAYARNLIIADLRRRGILTDDMLVEMAVAV